MLAELTLANGKRINTTTGRVVKEKVRDEELLEVPSASSAVERVIAVRRRLIDLPAPPAQMNGIAVIISYTLMGLSEEEIGIALGLTVTQIGRIKMSDAFVSMKKDIIDGIVEQDADDVRQMFVKHSKTAANKVLDLAQNADSEKVQFSAAQDILDRAGLRPADVVMHKHTMEGGLRIEYIEKKPLDVPTITIDGEVA